MSATKLPPDLLKHLLLGVNSNTHVKELELNLSCNELKSAGTQVLVDCIADIRNVSSLHLAENGLDTETYDLINAISQNTSIKHLYLDRNFNNVKPKYLADVLNALAHMIHEDNSVLETLSLADMKLKTSIYKLFDALGRNTSLTKLDIRGNMVGDWGAKVLAKALQVNCKLHTLYWDRNHITANGYWEIASALERNFTLQYMPCPVNDVLVSTKTQPERTEQAIHKIEESLHRNRIPHQKKSNQQYKLLVTSTQELLTRMIKEVERSLIEVENDEERKDNVDEIKRAKLCVNEAYNARKLLSQLYEVIFTDEQRYNNMEQKLSEVSEELQTAIEEQLQTNLRNMIKCVEEGCSHVLEDSLKAEIEKCCERKLRLPDGFVRSKIVSDTGSSISSKINELSLSVAAHISDRVIDEVLDTLSSCKRRLGKISRGEKLEDEDNVLPTLGGENEVAEEEKSNMSEMKRLENGEDCTSPISEETEDTQTDLLSTQTSSSPKMSSKKRVVAYAKKMRPESFIDPDVVAAARALQRPYMPPLTAASSDDSLDSEGTSGIVRSGSVDSALSDNSQEWLEGPGSGQNRVSLSNDVTKQQAVVEKNEEEGRKENEGDKEEEVKREEKHIEGDAQKTITGDKIVKTDSTGKSDRVVQVKDAVDSTNVDNSDTVTATPVVLSNISKSRPRLMGRKKPTRGILKQQHQESQTIGLNDGLDEFFSPSTGKIKASSGSAPSSSSLSRNPTHSAPPRTKKVSPIAGNARTKIDAKLDKKPGFMSGISNIFGRSKKSPELGRRSGGAVTLTPSPQPSAITTTLSPSIPLADATTEESSDSLGELQSDNQPRQISPQRVSKSMSPMFGQGLLAEIKAKQEKRSSVATDTLESSVALTSSRPSTGELTERLSLNPIPKPRKEKSASPILGGHKSPAAEKPKPPTKPKPPPPPKPRPVSMFPLESSSGLGKKVPPKADISETDDDTTLVRSQSLTEEGKDRALAASAETAEEMKICDDVTGVENKDKQGSASGENREEPTDTGDNNVVFL